MSRLKAIFRFRNDGDPEAKLAPIKVLLRTLAVLKFSDRQATLKIMPDEPDPPQFDCDGD